MKTANKSKHSKSESAPKVERKGPVSSIPAERSAKTAARRERKTPAGLALFCLASLGVVFGDIGTSPLYAVRQCFQTTAASTRIAPDQPNVLGVLSLIVWALIIIISIKYLLYVMAAENKGEGGILALLALFNRRGGKSAWFTALSLFGAALLFGDGLITPAISVISSIEGLKVATPMFQPFIIPIAVVILVSLFLFQKKGTGHVGLVFGPVMLLWFITIALLGIASIVRHPAVLVAFNPLHAIIFFQRNGFAGFVVLGAVFLAVTGGEALYADLGHFGRRPIRNTWFVVVLPALLLNYFGQGALILDNNQRVQHPFFNLAPGWALYPLVILATVAAIIASQAVISGVFSLTRQAVLMDEFPRVKIAQTSAAELGQVYVPVLNFMMAIACIGLVIGFPSSERLAGAYGVAVSATMLITTVLAGAIARRIWNWNKLVAVAITTGFLVIDIAFFSANILKFIEGGWFPLLVGAVLFIIMTTWKRGRTLVRERLLDKTDSLDDVLSAAGDKAVKRVPGSSVFLTNRPRGTPPVLVQHIEHSHSLTDNVIILHVTTTDEPHVPLEERIEFEKLRHGIYRVQLKFGFIDLPDVPATLRELKVGDTDIKLRDVTYYVGRSIPVRREQCPRMMRWRHELFAFLSRNAARTVDFFRLPAKRVVELGLELDI